jgi:hypothetical protein
MGTPERPQEIKDDLDRLFQLIDDEKFDQARDLRQQLAKSMKDEDPNFVRADWLIHLGTAQNEIH